MLTKHKFVILSIERRSFHLILHNWGLWRTSSLHPAKEPRGSRSSAVRALLSHSRGPWFESRCDHHFCASLKLRSARHLERRSALPDLLRRRATIPNSKQCLIQYSPVIHAAMNKTTAIKGREKNSDGNWLLLCWYF